LTQKRSSGYNTFPGIQGKSAGVVDRLEQYFLSLIRGEKRGTWAALQRGGLRVLSEPYGWAMRLRNRLYDAGWKRSRRALVPVVSVGNLTLGGTGKTPCVEFIARFYRERELRVAVLSRGYGSSEGRNDEALVLEENLPDVPHLQGVDRAALAEIAVLELESEVLILDDGFQHRRLQRDLDVVLIDATNPWGQGYIFPRGLLREPVSSLRRAGVIVLTRCDQVEWSEVERIKARLAKRVPAVPVVESSHRPAAWINSKQEQQPLEEIGRRPLAAFCGIGNPEAFRRTLLNLGATIADFRTYPDHHDYTRDDVEELRTWARRQATECVVVTTQKDLVKLRLDRVGERELWALRILLHIDAGRELLEEKLSGIVRRS
jgi:tetraacyldisaccharide 4'-kinase